MPEALSVIAVIGAGPSGLMAAEVAASAGAAVTVYDHMPSPGRKLLMAGRGGLNLTHSEPADRFYARYGEAAAALHPALAAFDSAALRAWSDGLGQPTFVGSSGRVFPQGFKASPLLRAWLRRLDRMGVQFRFRHRWQGWTADGALDFATPDGPHITRAAATVLALGGASWPRLGSDGAWTSLLVDADVPIAPLRSSNCGFVADWSPSVGTRFAGSPLKGIALRFQEIAVRGEAMITSTGLEGGAVYALSPPLREAIARDDEAILEIALKPDLTAPVIAGKLEAQPAKASLSSRLRKALHLSPQAIALVQEARHGRAAGVPTETLVNAVPVRLTACAPLGSAISTAGGVQFAGLDDRLMLQRRPGTFVAGEMIDWEAPTGGYLLQACFATGVAAGLGAAHWLGAKT